MNQHEAQKVIDGLREAQTTDASVVELVGDDARRFGFVNYKAEPKEVLASFSIGGTPVFFAILTARPSGEISFAVYDHRRGMVLSTVDLNDRGLLWTYQPGKQSGDNEARKRKFRSLANGDSLTFPLPSENFAEFCATIRQATDLRRVADDAEDGDVWLPPEAVLPPLKDLPPSRFANTKVPGIVWQLCTQQQGATLEQLDGRIDALQLRGSHSAKRMLARYATVHGCSVTAHGSGPDATYTLVPPESSNAATNTDETMFDDILDQLRAASLTFSAEVVASFILALQTKRFVLLTGISGTGKTRLAQEIAHAFESEQAQTNDEQEIVVRAQRYYFEQKSLVVPARLARAFDIIRTPEARHLDVQIPGQPPMPMTINTDGRSWLEVQLAGSVREWLQVNLRVGDPLVLARGSDGDTEWLELRLPHERRVPRPDGRQTELIAVRPDWTDKSAIFGFYNPLTKDYITTPVLQLLLRAHADANSAATDHEPLRPYFLIFDEMNLARVEHYFSDFLSAMESGEAIHLHDDARLEESEGIPRRLTLPSNVFVVGTVNVDETTYMFSPKVLDRAFVLEFNDVNLDALLADATDDTPIALNRFERLEMRGRATDDEWEAFTTTLGGSALATLRKIHDALEKQNRHFGYRVAREVARFIHLASAQTNGDEAAIRRALDIAVLAKILPKLHGPQAEIEEILKALLVIAIGTANDAALLPNTAKKLSRMLNRLSTRGFVSFIE